MPRRTDVLLCLVALLAFPDEGHADPIVPVAQVRSHSYVTYDYGDPFEGETISAADFGPFAVGTRHVSTIGADRMDGELRASGWADDSSGEIEHSETSVFQVDFDLTEERDFLLDAALNQGSSINPAYGSSQISLSLFDADLGSFVPLFAYQIQGEFDLDSLVVDESGTLSPGLYRLFARAAGTGWIHSFEGAVGSRGSVTFAFTVPEPSTGLLLLLGLAGVLASTRRPGRAD